MAWRLPQYQPKKSFPFFVIELSGWLLMYHKWLKFLKTNLTGKLQTNRRNVETSQHGFKDQSLRIEIVWKFCLWGLFDNLIINSPISYDPLGIFKMLSRMGHYNGLCNAICMVPLWCQNWVIKFVWICSSAHSKLCKKGSACYSGNQIQFFYTDIWVWEVKSYSGFPVLTLNS